MKQAECRFPHPAVLRIDDWLEEFLVRFEMRNLLNNLHPCNIPQQKFNFNYNKQYSGKHFDLILHFFQIFAYFSNILYMHCLDMETAILYSNKQG